MQRFDATFEVHCDGADVAARGEVHVTTPPPPPVLDLKLAVDPEGLVSTLNGEATIHGTVTCNEPVRSTVSGHVTQVVHRVVNRNAFDYVDVDCTPDAPVPWTASVAPAGTIAFQQGDAEVGANATAMDPIYRDYLTVSQTVPVHLRKK